MMYDKLTALLVCAGLKTTPVGGGRLKIGKPVPTHPHIRSTMLKTGRSMNTNRSQQYDYIPNYTDQYLLGWDGMCMRRRCSQQPA